MLAKAKRSLTLEMARGESWRATPVRSLDKDELPFRVQCLQLRIFGGLIMRRRQLLTGADCGCRTNCKASLKSDLIFGRCLAVRSGIALYSLFAQPYLS